MDVFNAVTDVSAYSFDVVSYLLQICRNIECNLTVFQLNFLVQKEILSAKSHRLRADVLAHFIKVAKVHLHLLFSNVIGLVH